MTPIENAGRTTHATPTWSARMLAIAAVAAVMGASPGSVQAQGLSGGSHVTEGRPAPSRPVFPPGVAPRPFPPRPPFPQPPRHVPPPHHRHVVSSWPTVLVYAPPAVPVEPPPSYDPPMLYAPMPAYDPAPAPPATASTIEYPTGRYELRGDGVTTPYTWVWIPNPPPPPPAGPPIAQAPTDPVPTPRTHVYHWVDEEGVVHLTDAWDSVPGQYRAQAKQLPSY